MKDGSRVNGMSIKTWDLTIFVRLQRRQWPISQGHTSKMTLPSETLIQIQWLTINPGKKEFRYKF